MESVGEGKVLSWWVLNWMKYYSNLKSCYFFTLPKLSIGKHWCSIFHHQQTTFLSHEPPPSPMPTAAATLPLWPTAITVLAIIDCWQPWQHTQMMTATMWQHQVTTCWKMVKRTWHLCHVVQTVTMHAVITVQTIQVSTPIAFLTPCHYYHTTCRGSVCRSSVGTEKETEIELNPTAKDRTTGCSCTNSENFRLPVARFVKKLKNRKKTGLDRLQPVFCPVMCRNLLAHTFP